MSSQEPPSVKGRKNDYNREGYFDLDGKQYETLHELTSAGYEYFWNKHWRRREKPRSVPTTYILTMDIKL